MRGINSLATVRRSRRRAAVAAAQMSSERRFAAFEISSRALAMTSSLAASAGWAPALRQAAKTSRRTSRCVYLRADGAQTSSAGSASACKGSKIGKFSS